MYWRNKKGFHSSHLKEKTLDERLKAHLKPKGIVQRIRKLIHRKVKCAYSECHNDYLPANGVWINIFGFKGFKHNGKKWFCDYLCLFEYLHDIDYRDN